MKKRREMLEEEWRKVERLEEMYGRLAERFEPAELEENPVAAARVCLAALRGMERCVELRIKCLREAERMPEPEEEPRATVDWSRLSDGALREVEEALVPCGGEGGGPEEVVPLETGGSERVPEGADCAERDVPEEVLEPNRSDGESPAGLKRGAGRCGARDRFPVRGRSSGSSRGGSPERSPARAEGRGGAARRGRGG